MMGSDAHANVWKWDEKELIRENKLGFEGINQRELVIAPVPLCRLREMTGESASVETNILCDYTLICAS